MNISDPFEDESYPGRPIQAGHLRVPPALHMYLNWPIDKICRNSIVHEHGQNHCAHFVCHVMGYNHIPGALKCTVRGMGGTNGVHIRVNEVFNYAPDRQMWRAGTELSEPRLVVATIAQNVHGAQAPTVGQHRRKHIGIYTAGLIWHYSTHRTSVFADLPGDWRRRMEQTYGANGEYTVLFLSSGLLRV
jgi:hypothetical protein